MEMYNRYRGNTGRVQRVGESRRQQSPERRPEEPAKINGGSAPHSSGGPGKGMGEGGKAFGPGLLGGLASSLPERLKGLDTEDIILLLLLYLLYRRSGDTEFLIIMGAMFLI